MTETTDTAFDLVVFGGAGDLTTRKLVPALFWRHRDGVLPPGAIIGASRRTMDRDTYVAALEPGCRTPEGGTCSNDEWAGFAERLDFVSVDAVDGASYGALAERLAGGEERARVFYLATSPKLFGPISRNLRDAGLITHQSRVVLEKPIGHDLASAQAVNATVSEAFEERQVFRIDHYLGKETVQNLMALRFANVLLEPQWRASMIDHVQITVAEELGVEGRGGYYDHAGALRDMVQNHMLQLLCLVAMEPPSAFKPGAVQDEKLKVLRALRPIGPADLTEKTVRGQYTAGAVAGVSVPGYLEEDGVDPASTTETFVALKAEIDNWRWAGTPFYLRTGKRLQSRVSEIVIQFKPVPFHLFGAASSGVPANRLILRLQPDESVRLLIKTKVPGHGMRLKPVHLDLSLEAAHETRSPDAYERLLGDVIAGDPTLFMRRDEVEAAWQWTGPILEGWENDGERPTPYVTGTWGPGRAIAMIERDGRTWSEDA